MQALTPGMAPGMAPAAMPSLQAQPAPGATAQADPAAAQPGLLPGLPDIFGRKMLQVRAPPHPYDRLWQAVAAAILQSASLPA